MRKLFDHACRGADTRGYCPHLSKPERMILDQFFIDHGLAPSKRRPGPPMALHPNPTEPNGSNWRARVTGRRLRQIAEET